MLKGLIALVAGVLFLPVLIGAVAAGNSGRAAPAEVPGIPPVLLEAYLRAAAGVPEHRPRCEGVRWQILAGVGKVESNHANGRDITPSGDITPRILGPRLDGSGAGGNTTAHRDTDGGQWDNDTAFDRAVGPMQFIPSTWAAHGLTSSSGEADPHNAYDAALSAAAYLCGTHTTDLTDRGELRAALLRYNASSDYAEDVLGWIDHYDTLPASTAADGGSEAGQTAAEWALQQVGKPYAWGGTGPDAFDCSGLTMKAWHAAGIQIPRVTTDQYRHGTRISLEELQPGDLLFYDTTDYAPGGAPSHVTMYVGDGHMVNAPSRGKPIRVELVESVFYTPRFMGATRPG